ncbi:MAG: Trp biosynthesis-associated membrane protein, partial [Micromonosporaceae bacterium]
MRGSPRRELGAAVLASAAGAGLALLAANRTWAVRQTPRPAPLSALHESYTGAELLSWLPAVAFVGLAAGIALLATHGVGRRLVGLTAVGCGLA